MCLGLPIPPKIWSPLIDNSLPEEARKPFYMSWITSYFDHGDLSKRDIDAIKDADHTYIRGNESQRSPCPFLNALANHNYLSVTPTLLPNSLTKQP